MDPFTAIGVASSIATFVDLGFKFIKGTSEIYQSANGCTSENTHAELVSRRLQQTCLDLERDTASSSAEAKRLQPLAHECRALSVDLLRLIQKGKSKKWCSKFEWRGRVLQFEICEGKEGY